MQLRLICNTASLICTAVLSAFCAVPAGWPGAAVQLLESAAAGHGGGAGGADTQVCEARSRVYLTGFD
jgi:hypothetical protein